MPYPPVTPPQSPSAPQYAYGQGGGTGGGGGGGFSAGPTFRAWQSTGQAVPAGAFTKINYQTEDWDTDAAFASDRFTAPEAGYYYFTAAAGMTTALTANSVLALYKNGAVHTSGDQPDSGVYRLTVSGQIKLDVGDYVEVFAFFNAARTVQNRIDSTFFSGHMVRPT